MTSPEVAGPTFEHHFNGLGVATATPRLSWTFISSCLTVRAWTQTLYEIEITLAEESGPQTFRIASPNSVLVPWPAQPLKSRQTASVRPSEWSPTSKVEAALLNPAEEFTANFITSIECFGSDTPLRPIRFRKELTLPHDFTANLDARLYITACGVFEAYINGKLVSDELLAPGWTSYNHRLAYRIYDVSSLLLPDGVNIICAEVGDGWYAGRIGLRGGQSFTYGKNIGLAAQLEVRNDDKQVCTLVTDDTWLCAPSARIHSEIYDGETYDTREEQEDWREIGAAWISTASQVKVLPRPSAKLVAVNAAPVRVTETVRCKKMFKSRTGQSILDFGQNIVGRLFVPLLQLESDKEVSFRHAEVMEDDELGVRPLRTAKAMDTIIGSGKAITGWSPKFTFHGFRYVQVNGLARGFFECSNSSVHQLHRNVVWSMRGNFVSLPTDCPQRDERLGWTGDIQAFTPTANFLYDTVGILESWLQDLSAEQFEEGHGGIPPLVVPSAHMPHWPHISQAVWDDVAILTPASLYLYSADKALLERQFESMQTWLDTGVDRAPDGLWNPDKWQLSDWLDPAAPPDDPGNARTDGIMVANEFLIHVTHTFAELCTTLGKLELASKHSRDASHLKRIFQDRYISREGNLMGATQTGIALAIHHNLYQPSNIQRLTAATALEKLVRTARFHVATGFAGTPIITHALTRIGQPQLAYRMLLEQTCPSWLYAVSMGATTIWERWDNMLPNGHINPGQMTSFNHYAYGSVADWLHGTVGGISPSEPGWRTIRVRPVPGGNLKHAKAVFEGPYGRVVCQWTWEEGRFWVRIEVPPNCQAIVTLPSEVRRSYRVEQDEEPTRVVSSGVHEFECEYDAGVWPPKPLIGAFLDMPKDEIAV